MRQRGAIQWIAGEIAPGADGHAFLDPVFVGTQRTLEGERLSVIGPDHEAEAAREGDLGARSNSTTIKIGVNDASKPHMELLVFSPDDHHPRSRFFDGPVMVGVQQAVGENAEIVPGFTSISHDGAIHKCVAYYDRDAKKNGRPINAWATGLWHTAMKREGFERGLRREDGAVVDWLNGNVVVIYSGGLLDAK